MKHLELARKTTNQTVLASLLRSPEWMERLVATRRIKDQHLLTAMLADANGDVRRVARERLYEGLATVDAQVPINPQTAGGEK